MNSGNDKHTAIEPDERTSDADGELSRAMRTLKRVEAPADFNFRLKARIAGAVPASKRRPRLSPALVYILPILVLAGVAGLFLIRQDKPDSTAAFDQAPQRASLLSEQGTTPGSPDGPAAAQPFAANAASNTAERPRAAASTAAQTASREAIPVANKTTSAGSFDTAIESSKPILPRGLVPNSAVTANAAAASTAALGVPQILRMLGVDARYGPSGWKVTGVTADSMADRAGVKTGDIIEAIDDHKLGEKTTFDRTVSMNRLSIIRGGAALKIVIGGQ